MSHPDAELVAASQAASRRLLFAVLALATGFTMVFWPFLRSNIMWAVELPSDWGHILVIPFIAGYLVYLNREKLLAQPFRTTWVGLVPVIFGVAWYFICTFGPNALHHKNLMSVGVISTISGLVLLFCGFRAMVYLWFPLVYLWVFGQNISERMMNLVTFKLQDIAAVGSWIGLNLIGVETERSGNALTIYDHGVAKYLNIAEACSGMRMLMAFMALGVAMAYTGLKYRWQQATLVLMAVPTALFVNILRVMSLGLLSLLDTGFAAGNFHSFIGLIWLIPAFLIYLGIMWVLKHMIIETKSSVKESQKDSPRMVLATLFDRNAKVAVIISVSTMVVCGFGFRAAVDQLNVFLNKEEVSLRIHFASLPRSMGDWQAYGDDSQLSAEMVEELGTDKYLSRRYALFGNPDESSIWLHIAYYTGVIDAVPHVPDRCLVANSNMDLMGNPQNLDLNIDRSQWRLDAEITNHVTGQPYEYFVFVDQLGRLTEVSMPLGDFQMRTSEFQDRDNPDNRVFAGYFFVANGRITPSPDKVRALAFDMTDRYAYYCKVQFLTYASPDMETSDFTAQVSDFLNQLLPHLMRSLPDWPEVESRSQPTASPQIKTKPA